MDNIKKFLPAYCLFSFSLFLFLFENDSYGILAQYGLEQYWLLLPIGIYIILAILAKSFNVIRVVSVSL